MGTAVTDPRATAMPRIPPPPSRLRHPRGRPGGRIRALAGAGPAALAVVLGLALAGCAGQQPAPRGPRMQLDTATVNSSVGSSPIDAYLVIRNNGATDRLVSARSSAGGIVTLSGPAAGNPAAMRAVAAITVPGHTLIRLVPNGYHLIITDSGPMKSGTEITLTLRFAHAGTYHVAAEVTNPQTGGSSYFLN
jgi:copper(I)-binding protein